MTHDDLTLLDLICREVERKHIDLAPTYDAWIAVAYGLATDFGEEGRTYFHRICSQYHKGHQREDIDKCYTYCLQHNRRQVHFGSVCLLARQAGVDTAALRSYLARMEREARAAAAQGGTESAGSTGGADRGAAGADAPRAGAPGGGAGADGADVDGGAIADGGAAAPGDPPPALGGVARARVPYIGAAPAAAVGEPPTAAAAPTAGATLAAAWGATGAGAAASAMTSAPAPSLSPGAAPLAGSEPLAPLSLLQGADTVWPRALQLAIGPASEVDGQVVPPYRDVLLLGTLTAMGASLGHTVSTIYSRREQYANLQTFIVAPAASGKGVLSFVRLITDPIHHAKRQAYQQARADYEQQKVAWDNLGRKRAEVPQPKEPPLSMFYIPGNITGTGIHQLIIDNQGTGFIFELEADTVSTAVQSDYGHWSDTLRKCFDNAGISYFRRTGQEYREAKETFVSVLLSGTPGQVPPLIPSAENGLFSRQVFYYMPGVNEFRNQYDISDAPLTAHYQRLGGVYCQWLDVVRTQGRYRLLLSDEQKAAFNQAMSHLFTYSILMADREMNSWVVRAAINLNRMLMVVALLRATEPTFNAIEHDGTPPRELLYEPTLLEPTGGINQARRTTDLPTPHYALFATDSDFQAVIAMAQPLMEHATHVLSMLKASTVSRRLVAEQLTFFDALPEEFKLQEAKQLAESRGLTAKQAEHWIYRWRDHGLLTPTDKAGGYRKTSPQTFRPYPTETPEEQGRDGDGGNEGSSDGAVDKGDGGT